MGKNLYLVQTKMNTSYEKGGVHLRLFGRFDRLHTTFIISEFNRDDVSKMLY